jgi:lipopolysaccharide transport system ATP-binding protein
MSDVAIRCERLAKQYRIGERESYKALRDVIAGAFSSPFRRLRSALRHSSNGGAGSEKPYIWALKDVSFEIKRGEVVGIIGRNGAGKSTLLKILSRITEPTHGHADLCGRVGSLLEVGTGFHPELTGRENVFLNGAILGMKRAEIARKFDEIVAFAEVERFIDTPVKHYSSGMYVRLAFAVAAHLETEVLFVDEVLAVGDIAFQRKCLGRMGTAAKEGRTVMFVSHNLAAVRNLCSRTILITDGRIGSDADTATAIACYLEDLKGNADTIRSISEQIKALPTDPQFRLISAALSQGDNESEHFVSHEPIILQLEYEVLERAVGLRVGFDLILEEGILFRSFDDDDPAVPVRAWSPGRYRSTAQIPSNLLRPGNYFASPAVGAYGVRSIIDNVLRIPFCVRNVVGVGSQYSFDQRPGAIMPHIDWERHHSRSDDVTEIGTARTTTQP